LARPFETIDDPCQLWRGQLQMDLQQIDALQGCLETTTAKLDELNKEKKPVELLETIPGVDPRTAEAIVAVVDDPSRFKSCRQICNYVGFTPRRFQSGQMDRTGRISKRGNPLLRALLVQASWAAPSPEFAIWKEGFFANCASARAISHRFFRFGPRRLLLLLVLLLRLPLAFLRGWGY